MSGDERLRRALQAAHSDERPPSFGAVRARRAARRPPVLPVLLATMAAVLLAVVFLRSDRREAGALGATSTVTLPLDFLLETPTSFLSETPTFQGEWSTQ